MDRIRIPEKELQSYFDTKQLLEEVLAQFSKDFSVFESLDQLVFSKTDPQQFVKELSEVLAFFVERNPELFMQSLYAVDLPERIIQQYYTTNTMVWEDLVDFIYRRLVLKVFLRKKFSAE